MDSDEKLSENIDVLCWEEEEVSPLDERSVEKRTSLNCAAVMAPNLSLRFHF